MKPGLFLFFLCLARVSVAQSLTDFITSTSPVPLEKLPEEVYVTDLCKECDIWGFDEYRLFTPGGSFLDKSTSRDFRTFILHKTAKFLNPASDSFEDCDIMYVLYSNREQYERELQKLPETYIHSLTKYESKSPLTRANKVYDMSLTPFSWPHSSKHAILLNGFQIVLSAVR